MCKRAVLCSFLLDQNHREQGDEDGYREEKGGQQQGGAGQVHSHPATASGLSTAVTWGTLTGGSCPQVPEQQGTAALPGRASSMALCPTEEKQKSTAMEAVWGSLAPHKFYFLLHFIFLGPVHTTTCSYKLGATNRQTAGQNVSHHASSNVSITATVSVAQPCDASQEQPEPPSPTGAGESHGCHSTTVTVIPNKGTCCKLPSSCLVLAGLCYGDKTKQTFIFSELTTKNEKLVVCFPSADEGESCSQRPLLETTPQWTQHQVISFLLRVFGMDLVRNKRMRAPSHTLMQPHHLPPVSLDVDQA